MLARWGQALIAVPPLIGISLATTRSPIPYVPPLGYAAIVLLSMTIPARLALRTHRPIDAITNRRVVASFSSTEGAFGKFSTDPRRPAR